MLSEVFDHVSHFQQDDRHHCFLIFKKVDDDSIPTATILHYLAVAPTRIGNPTPQDGLWHLTANQPIGSHQITVDLPPDLFTQGVAVQTFVPNRIQGEVGNEPDLEQLIPEISDANLEDLELIKTPRNAMWIPNQYAVLLLDDDLSPVTTGVRVYGAILQNGHLDAKSSFYVIKPSPIPEVQAAMTGQNFQLRTLLRNGVRAPKATNGEEICMSYHTVNRCFSDCARRSTHRPLIGNESTVFCTFIQENVVAPDIGRS